MKLRRTHAEALRFYPHPDRLSVVVTDGRNEWSFPRGTSLADILKEVTR